MPRGVNTQDEGRIQGRNVVNANSSNIVAPGIVTDGLVLHLDAGNYESYPGTGSVWKDISGRGEDFTLFNSPSFATTNGGELLFSGSNDYARIRTSNSIKQIAENGSVDLWFRSISSTLGVGNARLISVNTESQTGSDTSGTQGSNTDYYEYFTILHGGNSQTLDIWYKSNPASFGPTAIVSTNIYFNASVNWLKSGASMIFDFYLNGKLEATTTVTQSAYGSAASTITIGQNAVGALTSPFENGSCAFSSLKFYAKSLTPSEVAQNFNALRSRFNI